MIEDKCPTCPMYGKGYCDCGRSRLKAEANKFLIILITLLFVVFEIVLILIYNTK